MSDRTSASLAPRRITRPALVALSLVTLAALDACGGGSGSSGTPTATVTSINVSGLTTALRYSGQALVTINGTGLDTSGFVVSSGGCSSMTRLTATPNASTSSIAYYSCTVNGAVSATGAGTIGSSVVVTSNGTQVGSQTYTMPEPQVSMSVTNGLNVNGTIVLTLSPDLTPLTAANFLNYVNTGFYVGTIFHRVVADFVVQGGGYTATVNGVLPAPKATNAGIPLETGGGSNVQWSVAMANDGQPDSTTSQFYINLVDNPQLDGGYSVFASITQGTDVVTNMVTAATSNPADCTTDNGDGTNDCLPQPDITISAATQIQ